MIVTCIATLAAIACDGRVSVFAASPEKPNVVIFYADDLGWGETGAFGSKDIPTPNIDSLANKVKELTAIYETWNKQQAEPSVPNDPPKNANAKNNKQGNKNGNAPKKKQAVN